jgi:hypothetical protein
MVQSSMSLCFMRAITNPVAGSPCTPFGSEIQWSKAHWPNGLKVHFAFLHLARIDVRHLSLKWLTGMGALIHLLALSITISKQPLPVSTSSTNVGPAGPLARTVMVSWLIGLSVLCLVGLTHSLCFLQCGEFTNEPTAQVQDNPD